MTSQNTSAKLNFFHKLNLNYTLGEIAFAISIADFVLICLIYFKFI